jgi:Tfp pilus assembly protein PilP
MKARTSIAVLLMMGCLAWADDPARKPAPAQTAKPAATKTAPAVAPTAATKPAPATPVKPAASKPATPAPTPAAKTAPVAAKPAVKPAADAAAKAGASKPASAAVAKPATAKVSPMKPRKNAKPAAAARAPELASRKAPLGKRDPFVSPIVTRVAGTTGCATGKKCLVIEQIVLRGTVTSPSGIIAVVENSAKKAYFLRENDPVFNGYVVKITGDSVVFKETVVDRVGHTNQREVVKRVTAPAV